METYWVGAVKDESFRSECSTNVWIEDKERQCAAPEPSGSWKQIKADLVCMHNTAEVHTTG